MSLWKVQLVNPKILQISPNQLSILVSDVVIAIKQISLGVRFCLYKSQFFIKGTRVQSRNDKFDRRKCDFVFILLPFGWPTLKQVLEVKHILSILVSSCLGKETYCSFPTRFVSSNPWCSLVVGDEGCIGPSRRLLCLSQTPQNYVAHTWHNSIHVWLLGRSSSSSPSTKKLYVQPLHRAVKRSNTVQSCQILPRSDHSVLFYHVNGPKTCLLVLNETSKIWWSNGTWTPTPVLESLLKGQHIDARRRALKISEKAALPFQKNKKNGSRRFFYRMWITKQLGSWLKETFPTEDFGPRGESINLMILPVCISALFFRLTQTKIIDKTSNCYLDSGIEPRWGHPQLPKVVRVIQGAFHVFYILLQSLIFTILIIVLYSKLEN